MDNQISLAPSEILSQLIGAKDKESKKMSVYELPYRDTMKKIHEYFIMLTPRGGGPISKQGEFNVVGNPRFPMFSLLAQDKDAYELFASFWNDNMERYSDILPGLSQDDMERLFLFFAEVLHHVETCNNMVGNSAENLFLNMVYHDGRFSLPTMWALKQDLRRVNPYKSVLIGLKLYSRRGFPKDFARKDFLYKAISNWAASLMVWSGRLYLAGEDYFILLLEVNKIKEGWEMAKKIRERFLLPWDIDDGSETLSLQCGCRVSLVACNAAGNDRNRLFSILEQKAGYVY